MHLVLLCTRYLFYICVHENMIPYQRKKSIDAFKWHCVDLVGNVYYTLCTQLLSRVGTWQLAGPTFFIAFVFCPVCCRGAGHFCTIDWWCGASMSFQWEAPRPAFVWPQTQWLVTHCSSSLLLLTAPPHCSSSLLLLTAPLLSFLPSPSPIFINGSFGVTPTLRLQLTIVFRRWVYYIIYIFRIYIKCHK